MQLLDTRPDHFKWVQHILQQHVPDAEVWAFGSRAKWLARDDSDLDLCIRAAAALNFEQMGALREAFDESDLPYKVDLVDWATASEAFRAIIERDRVVVQKDRLSTIDMQRAIAGVLGALDDKIEQNRRTARALERLARAIFRAWFVDFEPVKAKAEGRTAFPSMPQPVFDALPTRFVDSDLGPVPEGWEVKAVSVAFDVNPPRLLRKDETAPYLDFAIQNMTGTSGRQRVASTTMDHFRLAIPSDEVAIGFGEIVNPMFDCIRAGMEESRKLAEMRDDLLPKLLSGQVRVRESDKLIKRAA